MERTMSTAVVRARTERQDPPRPSLWSRADRRTAGSAAMKSGSKSFVDAHAPHRPCALPLFARVHIDPCERSWRRRPRPSASLEDAYVRAHRRTRVREDHPERERQSPREAGGRRGDLRSRCRTAERPEVDRLLSLGTSRWGKKRDVPLPAVFRERGTPECCAATALQWGRRLATSNSGLHPRRVHPPRERILNGSLHSRWRATSPASCAVRSPSSFISAMSVLPASRLGAGR